MLESGNLLSLSLKIQIQGYVNADPGQRQQKRLPLGVFKTLFRNTSISISSAIGELATGALFFGMRSCEYITVNGTRKTLLLRVKDVKFYR